MRRTRGVARLLSSLSLHISHTCGASRSLRLQPCAALCTLAKSAPPSASTAPQSELRANDYSPMSTIEGGFLAQADAELVHDFCAELRSAPTGSGTSPLIPAWARAGAIQALEVMAQQAPAQLWRNNAELHSWLAGANLWDREVLLAAADPLLAKAVIAQHSKARDASPALLSLRELTAMLHTVLPAWAQAQGIQAPATPEPAAPGFGTAPASRPAPKPTTQYTPTVAIDTGLSAEDRAVIQAGMQPLYAHADAMTLAEDFYGIPPQLWVRSVAKLRRVLCSTPFEVLMPCESEQAVATARARGELAALHIDPVLPASVRGMAAAREYLDAQAARVAARARLRNQATLHTITAVHAALCIAGPQDSQLNASAAWTEERAVLALRGALSRLHAASSSRDPDAHPVYMDWVPLVARAAEVYFGEDVSTARAMRDTADLRQPHQWYPLARSMKRRIVYHAGPTNSGKTYRALQALKAARSGVFAGPLRLLALEVYETLNTAGCITNLITGQEKKELPFASHIACTVEMAPTDRTVDVAVLDEIQLLGDPWRGWAWTRALLGIAAPEIHLCGDPAAIPAVQAIAQLCGDELEINYYSRRSTLEVSDETLGGSLARVQPGDAVIAFTRRNIYAIRRAIEQSTPYKCCLIYGSLPPETRSAQARLFNEPDSGYDVLVASDAVGMGLNLNIRRVVFQAVHKFDGTTKRELLAPEAKQIAGRAGRAGTRWPNGIATTLHAADLPVLREALDAPVVPIERAGICPTDEQLVAFEAHMPAGTSLPKLLSAFVEASRLDGSAYFMGRMDHIMAAAKALEAVPGLDLRTRYTLCAAPVQLQREDLKAYFLAWAHALAAGRVATMDVQLPLEGAWDVHGMESMELLETRAASLDLYIWLAQKFPASFPQLAAALAAKQQAVRWIESGLESLTARRHRTARPAAGVSHTLASQRTAHAHMGGHTRSGGRRHRPGSSRTRAQRSSSSSSAAASSM